MRGLARAYFYAESRTLTSTELVALIGHAGDELVEKDSLRPGRPVTSSWELRSGLEREAPLWEHLPALYARLQPLTEQLARLAGLDVGLGLNIVRWFEEEPGPASQRTSPGLGFALDTNWLRLLADLHGDLDIDEYDWTT
jgi:Domain of unknown function (DUF4279)